MSAESGPSATDWEDMRPIIKTLYLDKDWPLGEVMAAVESIYGFKASSQMYKRRLAKWSMRKNCHPTDLQKLARLERRSSVDDESFCRTRHSPGPSRVKVLRYARRKGIALQEDPQRAGMKKLVAVQGTPSRPIKGRDETSCVEHLCWVLHGFLDADATAHPSTLHAWRQSTGNTKVLATINHIGPAMQLFHAGQHQEAAKHISYFYDGAKSILEAYPVLLTRDVLAMTVYGHSATPELLCQVIRHFRDLSSIIYGPTHPLTVLLAWISANCAPESKSSTETTAATSSAVLLIKILHNYCLGMVGPDHYDTADCEVLLTVWQSNPVPSLQALLRRYDATYGLGSYQSLQCLGNILSVVVRRHDWPTFRGVLTDLARRPAYLSAVGGGRLKCYVQTCRDTLEAYSHCDHADHCAATTSLEYEIESIGMRYYMTLGADEWKMNGQLYCALSG